MFNQSRKHMVALNVSGAKLDLVQGITSLGVKNNCFDAAEEAGIAKTCLATLANLG